jgi:hypothetical protein
MFTKTVPKEQPKWYNLRWKLSNKLVWLARKIHPENPEVKAFWMDVMADQMITGQAIVRVNLEDVMKEAH